MELRDLKTFVAVAGLLNFNQAGRMLHAAQSTVSARIQTMEGELGVRLFDRLGRRVLLTEAGERLLDYAKKLVDLEEEARAWVGGDDKARGAISVRIPESLSVKRLPGLMHRFRTRFPNVRLRVLSCAFDGLAKDLRKGVTDLAFLLAHGVQAGDLHAEFLGTEPLALVAAPNHHLASRQSIMPQDLDGETVILSTSDCSYRRILESTLSDEGVAPFVAVEFNSVEAVKRHVAAGLGFTVLPAMAAAGEIAAGTLAVLPWADGELEAAVLMLRHKDKWISPALSGFMELAREHMGAG